MLDSIPNMTDLGIDPEAVGKLLPHIDSFAKWELLRFFHDNPDTQAGIEDLARYVGRDETELKPAARALASAALCEQVETPYGYAYGLTGDESLRQLIGHLVRGFVGDRLVRLAISSHILRSRRDASKLQFTTQ